MQEDDAEELAARQRLGRLNTRNSTAQSSRPPATASAASSTGGTARQSAASTSGRHVAPPKLSPDDSWAAELDNDDSWDSIDQKTVAGGFLLVCFCYSCCILIIPLLSEPCRSEKYLCLQQKAKLFVLLRHGSVPDCMLGLSSSNADVGLP